MGLDCIFSLVKVVCVRRKRVLCVLVSFLILNTFFSSTTAMPDPDAPEEVFKGKAYSIAPPPPDNSPENTDSEESVKKNKTTSLNYFGRPVSITQRRKTK